MLKRLIIMIMCLMMLGTQAIAGVEGSGVVFCDEDAVEPDGFVGNDSIPTAAIAMYVNRGVYTDVVATTTGEVSYCHVYIDNPSGDFNIAVYDSAGTTLIAQSNLTAFSVSGWNHFTLDSAVTITSGTTYRLSMGSKDDTSWSMRSTEPGGYTSYITYTYDVEDSMPSSCTGSNETKTGDIICMYLDNSAT